MKTFLLALISVLLVMVLTKANAINVNETPIKIKKESILPTLSEPVYAAEVPVAEIPTPTPKPAPVASSGSCEDWMRQAGITDIPTAMWLVQRESNCRPTAQNPTSTAYGIFQFLNSTWAGAGCTKTSEPVQQMVCGQRYVMNRYGSWQGAKNFWSQKGWY